MSRIAWIVANVGPYHHARFSSLASRVGQDLLVVEEAALQVRYPWSRPDGRGYEKVTLIEERAWEDVSHFDMTRRLLRVLAARRPDVIVVPGYSRPSYLGAALFGQLRGKTVVSVNVSTAIDRTRFWWRERVKGALVRHLFHGVFCAGTRTRLYTEMMGVQGDHIVEGYDVVDNEHFSRPREVPHAGLPAEPHFLSVCRFSPEKNLLFVLDEYGRYARDATRGGREVWPLVLCGSGPLEGELRARAAQLEVGRVYFPGFLGYEDLPAVYQRAGSLVLASLSEPWGLVVNEAMAASLPALVSERCGCVPELVQEGRTGYTFDPLEQGALFRLMRHMASVPEDDRAKMGRHARELVSLYTPETWTDAFVELMSRLEGPRSNAE